MSDRTILYVNSEGQQEQLDQCQELCTERGYDVIAVATETTGSTDAWEGAHAMVRDGDADRIVFSSGTSIPDMLESATGSIPGGGIHRRGPLKRIRLIQRGAEA
jgi:hypothetical protein